MRCHKKAQSQLPEMTSNLEKNGVKWILILIVSLLGACTTVAELKKPSKEQYFVLHEDFTRTTVKSTFGTFKLVEGLRAGTYTSIAEDERGTYFSCQGGCVIVLAREQAEGYLQTRTTQESWMRPGGLWIPKRGTSEGPKLFYEIRNTTDGAFAGIVGMSIVQMTEGVLDFVPFELDKTLLDKIRILDR